MRFYPLLTNILFLFVLFFLFFYFFDLFFTLHPIATTTKTHGYQCVFKTSRKTIVFPYLVDLYPQADNECYEALLIFKDTAPACTIMGSN